MKFDSRALVVARELFQLTITRSTAETACCTNSLRRVLWRSFYCNTKVDFGERPRGLPSSTQRLASIQNEYKFYCLADVFHLPRASGEMWVIKTNVECKHGEALSEMSFVWLMTCFPSTNYRHVMSVGEITATRNFCDYHSVSRSFFRNPIDRLLARHKIARIFPRRRSIMSFTDSVTDFRWKKYLRA